MNSKPSKSARKREQHALQALGEALIDLAPDDLAGMPLDPGLREAVETAKTIKSHGALRRQKQLIGKRMRQVDPEPIRAALASLQINDNRKKKVFREAEAWRQRIQSDAGALEAYLAHVDRPDSRVGAETAAWRRAASDRDRKAASKRLFREIHSDLEEMLQKEAGLI